MEGEKTSRGQNIVGIGIICAVLAFTINYVVKTAKEEGARREFIQRRAARAATLPPEPVGRPAQQPVQQLAPTPAELRQKFVAYIERLLRKGALRSVNTDAGFGRIDPAVWLSLDLESKQYLMWALSEYCKASGGTGQVEMRGDRNDRKLATGSFRWGVTILE